jgi:hypothetical protein
MGRVADKYKEKPKSRQGKGSERAFQAMRAAAGLARDVDGVILTTKLLPSNRTWR